MILQLLHFFQTCVLEMNKCFSVQLNITAINTIQYCWHNWDLPPHSSIRFAIVSASSSAIFRILLRPSRTTCTTCASFTVSRLQNGGITCFSMRWATCRETMTFITRSNSGFIGVWSLFSEKVGQTCLHSWNQSKLFFSWNLILTNRFSWWFLPDLSCHLLSGC